MWLKFKNSMKVLFEQLSMKNFFFHFNEMVYNTIIRTVKRAVNVSARGPCTRAKNT